MVLGPSAANPVDPRPYVQDDIVNRSVSHFRGSLEARSRSHREGVVPEKMDVVAGLCNGSPSSLCVPPFLEVQTQNTVEHSLERSPAVPRSPNLVRSEIGDASFSHPPSSSKCGSVRHDLHALKSFAHSPANPTTFRLEHFAATAPSPPKKRNSAHQRPTYHRVLSTGG